MRFYNRDGEPITITEWMALQAADDYRIVEQTEVNDYLVSTIWLGLDVNSEIVSGRDRQLFETMVFRGRPGEDVACYRWPTEARARQAHAELVTLILASEGSEPDPRANTKAELLGDE